jgi:hypothetical protein
MQDESIYVTQRPTNNPYLHGAHAILGRLCWDIHPAAWISTARLRRWKNRHAGQKAVIVCNGPSLLKSDLRLLDGLFTFGLNKINLLFESDPFRPSCIVAVNPFVVEQNVSFYNQTVIPLFVTSACRQLIRMRRNVAFVHTGQQKFARDCSVSLSEGHTVTYVAMQLAFHMGFSEVALIGCDHTYAAKGPANKTVVAQSEDRSHFDPRYFSGGVQWQLPDLEASEYYYHIARRVYEAHDRMLVNSTEGGALQVFERMPLAEFMARKALSPGGSK